MEFLKKSIHMDQIGCEEQTQITLEDDVNIADAKPDVYQVVTQQGHVELEEVRASLNDAYSEFYCDSLIDETTAPIDEEALRAEGLFPAVFLRTVDRLSEDVEGQIDYLQEEYLARNVPLTAALSEKKARQLTNEAARLVLDLLLQGGDDR